MCKLGITVEKDERVIVYDNDMSRMYILYFKQNVMQSSPNLPFNCRKPKLGLKGLLN